MSHIFISYSMKDREFVSRLYADLQANNINVWTAAYNVAAGDNWAPAIQKALDATTTLVAVISRNSIASANVQAEINYALGANKPVIPIFIDQPIEVPYRLSTLQYLDFTKDYTTAFQKLSGALKSFWKPDSEEEPPQDTSAQSTDTIPVPPNKGYVFISHTRDDEDFIHKLSAFLKERGYAYWDYLDSARNYHTALYLELEVQIEGAAAFLCILSDAWRDTPWPAREYVYAEDSNIPVFIIQAKPLERPVPMLINLQPRIDMFTDFDKGLEVLGSELDKKGL